MNGWPVWLASASLWDPRTREPIHTGDWTTKQRARMTNVLRELLGPVGDPSRERCFRMCLTLCLHRAVSDEEAAKAACDWRGKPPRDLAGGPVEVLWHRGVPSVPSCQPCRNPIKTPLDPRRPDLYFPDDCGRCDTCLERTRVRAEALLSAGYNEKGERVR